MYPLTSWHSALPHACWRGPTPRVGRGTNVGKSSKFTHKNSVSRIFIVDKKVSIIAATAIDISASYLLDHINLSQPVRIAVALLPLPGCVALLVVILQGVRSLDEFQKRVHFEAVVVSFLATAVAVFVYGYLQKAHATGSLNMGLVWLFMLVFYAIGYFVAVRHYQ